MFCFFSRTDGCQYIPQTYVKSACSVAVRKKAPEEQRGSAFYIKTN